MPAEPQAPWHAHRSPHRHRHGRAGRGAGHRPRGQRGHDLQLRSDLPRPIGGHGRRRGPDGPRGRPERRHPSARRRPRARLQRRKPHGRQHRLDPGRRQLRPSARRWPTTATPTSRSSAPASSTADKPTGFILNLNAGSSDELLIEDAGTTGDHWTLGNGGINTNAATSSSENILTSTLDKIEFRPGRATTSSARRAAPAPAPRTTAPARSSTSRAATAPTPSRAARTATS